MVAPVFVTTEEAPAAVGMLEPEGPLAVIEGAASVFYHCLLSSKFNLLGREEVVAILFVPVPRGLGPRLEVDGVAVCTAQATFLVAYPLEVVFEVVQWALSC